MRKLASIAAALLLAACGADDRQPPSPTPAQGEKLAIRVTAVPMLKPLAAEVRTRDQVEALARIPGVLETLSVRAGDQVAKGQVIGRVVDSRIAFQTDAYDAQIAAATAQAEAARAELKRIDYLYGQGVYAKARLEQAQAGSRAADAQVRAARAERSASTAAAGQGAIVAPGSGRILRADIPQGSVVAPGMSVATITAGPPLLRVDVPDSLALRLKPGARVTVQDDRAGGTTQGTVVQVYPAVSGGRVRADVAAPGLTTDLVGRRVTVLVEAGSRAGIVVPRRFVSTQFGMDYVHLVAKDGSAAPIAVQTAPAGDPGQVEILSGAGPGDVIVAPKVGR